MENWDEGYGVWLPCKIANYIHLWPDPNSTVLMSNYASFRFHARSLNPNYYLPLSCLSLFPLSWPLHSSLSLSLSRLCLPLQVRLRESVKAAFSTLNHFCFKFTMKLRLRLDLNSASISVVLGVLVTSMHHCEKLPSWAFWCQQFTFNNFRVVGICFSGILF